MITAQPSSPTVHPPIKYNLCCVNNVWLNGQNLILDYILSKDKKNLDILLQQSLEWLPEFSQMYYCTFYGFLQDLKRALSIISTAFYYFPVTMDILKFSFASFSGIVFPAGGSNSNKHRKVCALHKSYLLQESKDLSGLSMEADFFLPRFIRLLNFNPGVHFFLAK